MSKKYELTSETKEFSLKTLYRIKALRDFWNVKTGDLGGFIEKESNLSHDGNAWVSGDAQVYGNAWVYGYARLSAKLEYKKWWFIGGDDSCKITTLTKKQTWNEYWNVQYVLGDFEIKPIEEEEKFITDKSGKKYRLVPVD